METMTAAATGDASTTGNRKLARAFGLDGERWMRHANPASVWTRFSVLPLLALAIWSRDWIGVWCLIPVAAALGWMFVNPLLFGLPRSTRNWASRSVLGERIWVDRDRLELPDRFRSPVASWIANGYSIVGVGLLGYGLVDLDPVAAIAGLLLTQVGKAWYLDRMALLFTEMRDRSAEYASWDY